MTMALGPSSSWRPCASIHRFVVIAPTGFQVADPCRLHDGKSTAFARNRHLRPSASGRRFPLRADAGWRKFVR
jgi:hypothetical protein